MSGYPLHALAAFLGAFLVFLVQPIMGRFILPWFGGGTSVWTTCMLFFQAALLAGYAYAHLLTRSAPLRTQAVFHAALLGGAMFFLPIEPSEAWKPEPGVEPGGRILTLLCSTIGLPFLALAATAPLIQSWFAATHDGRSPYRLYAVSNAGSALALAVHPFVIEPLLTRRAQSLFWTGGMILFVAVCVGCAAALWRRGALRADLAQEGPDVAPSPAAGRGSLAWWLGLSACGSILLLTTTNELSQDAAVTPFLWVAPLAIYLVTFILCFGATRRYSRRRFGGGFIVSLAAVCAGIFFREELGFALHATLLAAALFFGCMVCHGELADLKPSPSRLTGYYLAISAGGALGGLFVGVAAPALFSDYHEFGIGLAGCAALLGRLVCRDGATTRARVATIATALLCGGVFLFDAWFSSRSSIKASRNFYGAVSIHEFEDGKARYLKHDNIVHGLQLLDEDMRGEPTCYYGPGGGGGMVMDSFRIDRSRRIGLVGLGVGTLAVYGREGDAIRVYEIDPAVIDAAENAFTFLKDTKATVDIVEGDARLLLEREAPQQFDVLVLDAFTSDAVPVHLLTLEAIETYRRHLAPGGVLAFHLSSQSLRLDRVVRSAAKELGLAHLAVNDHPAPRDWHLYDSQWMLVSEDAVALDRIATAHPSTRRGGSDETVRVWTDDYSSLMSALK